MPAEFEDQDLSDAVFWGVRLRGARLRDVDLTGVRTHHVVLRDVEFDGVVDRLVINGVDVTDYVHAHDPWQPFRAMTEPATAEEVRAAWSGLTAAWDELIADARRGGDEAVHTSVDGEWSLVETLRHLVFVADKWILGPLTDCDWEVIGLPNTGSQSFPWPGIDLDVAPTIDTVLAARARQRAAIEEVVGSVSDADLATVVEILENGRVTARDAWWALFEELFEHRRYMLRDLG